MSSQPAPKTRPQPPQSISSILHRLHEAITKGGGTYPLKGIPYFIAHPFLHPLLRARLLPALLLSTIILVLLFLFTYLPQVLLLTLFHGRASALFNAAILVLSESAGLTALLFEAWLVDATQVDVYDAILVARGHEELVKASRPVLGLEVSVEDGVRKPLDARTRLGRPAGTAIFAPFSVRQIVEFVLLLPLNLVPWVGVPLFLLATGYRAGPLLQWRYFALRGFSKKQRRAYVRQRQWAFTWFGAVYLVLQLIPVLSMVFLLTSAAGAALWAGEMEEQRKREEEEDRAFQRGGEDGGNEDGGYIDETVDGFVDDVDDPV
ncbi:hypothetical protein BT63DRAFT_477623 [Microthyrium microscopicum]|uniref:Uncharacterized protein n=1 Tax=Microthyrium microscopicum TaxID=703497 RepID=A0A6A6UHN6_9PEZI|nr:hypothetical protein BT63DRAFT_477623 [Microthyrium microscopicum]